MAYTFKPVDIPPDTRGRQAGLNPFLEPVAEMASDPTKQEKALSFNVTESNPDLLTKSLNRIASQLSKAGAENNVSVRKKIEADGNKATVTFWVTSRITRKRKPASL